MRKSYIVTLTPEERDKVLGVVRDDGKGARQTVRARALLLAHEGHTDKSIADELGVSISTVQRTRRRFAEDGLEHALREAPRTGPKRKLDEKQEAYLIALAAMEPPQDRERWTARLLAKKLAESGVAQRVSENTVRRTLKKASKGKA